jgi:hypothetical protein
MELQDTLYALGQQWGREVFDDPDRLRGLLASSGASGPEVDLVVDAARRGAHRGLVQALDAGADPARAIEATGDRLGQERGTDPAAARWVVAVLGFALGRVGEHDVRRQRGPGLPPGAAPTAFGQPTYPATPPQGFPAPSQQPYPGQPPYPGQQQPAYAAGYPQQQGYGQPAYGQQSGAWSPTPPKKSKLPILLGVGGAVLAIVVAVVLALVLTGGDDDDTAGKGSDQSTSAAPSTDPSTEPSAETSSAPTEPTEPTSEATSQAAPTGEVSAEAASGYTSALLAFSDAFGEGGEDLQAASTSDDPKKAKAAARKMRAAVKDLDTAVRGLELSAVQPEVDAFLDESGRILDAFDEIERTAKTTLDVNAGVGGLPITDYTDSFQAVADAIDASRTGG